MVNGEFRHRVHIHCATQLPQGGVAPAGFRKRGVDCIIFIDVRKMLRDGILIFRSAGGVVKHVDLPVSSTHLTLPTKRLVTIWADAR